ncbi:MULTISPECIES: hypothetical protein [unclassified Rhizobium]|uniref:hypothetical protein n=1 Tax=unclassified Rhizobium TaxID=2613769 RepID=UPI00288A2E57|nr:MULTISPECIES: hypothetical protein [unclassified Rhizobium]
MSDFADEIMDRAIAEDDARHSWRMACRESGCKKPEHFQNEDGFFECKECGRTYDL